MIKFFNFLLALFFLLISACQVGPTYYPPQSPKIQKWKHAHEQITVACVDHWWEIFNDPKLNEIEQYAVASNKNLYIALDRVAEARAQAWIVEADLYPQFSLNPAYNDQESLIQIFNRGTSSTNRNAKLPPPFIRARQRTYSLPINLSYELDLWGRMRDQYNAAVYSYEAEEEAYLTTLLMVTSDVASTYYQIRVLDTLLELYQRTIKTRQNALEINKARYTYQVSNELAVAQSGLDLSNVQSLYFNAVRQREIQVDALAVLLGVPPSEFAFETTPLKALPPVIPAGVPSDILIQRPDIAEAERTMASQQALIGAAYASFFPSLTLTGAMGFMSPDYSLFLKWISRYWQFGFNIGQTLYDGGRKNSQLDLAKDRFKEASDAYQQTVLVAFQEVEDALANLEWLVKEAESVQTAVNYARNAYQISMDRYLKGVDFYLQVVDSERQLLDNERASAELLGSQYISTIQLIKALGGSWNSSTLYSFY